MSDLTDRDQLAALITTMLVASADMGGIADAIIAAGFRKDTLAEDTLRNARLLADDWALGPLRDLLKDGTDG